MKIVLGVILFFVVLSSIGFGYSLQNDVIPIWIKGVAGFWAEDKITDQEFIEALEYLINNEIIIIPRIEELERELDYMRNNEEINPEPVKEQENDTTESNEYIITDKIQYTLLDTINVKASIDLERKVQKLDGSNNINLVKFNIGHDEGYTPEHSIIIWCARNNDVDNRISSNPNFEPDVWYRSARISVDDNGYPEKCNVDEYGVFEFSTVIDEGYYAGLHYIRAWTDNGHLTSQLFTIR